MPKLAHKLVPVRSKTAVNKSLRAQSVNRESKGISKAVNKQDDDERLDEIFRRNIDIATALLPIVSMKHAQPVRKWITKLFDPSLPKPKRNNYLLFLIFQMQNIRILDPFDKNPPQTLIDPSKFGTAKWKTMMLEGEKDFQERRRERICVPHWGRFKRDFKTPRDFLDDQPLPSNGYFCYGGCFSNHFQ
jgi:hypothetical protein